MRIDGRTAIATDPQSLWDFLLDLDRFSSCLPGLSSARRVDDTTFEGVLGVKLGPMSGSFEFKSVVVESVPPKSMKVQIEGRDSVTGSTIRTDVDLDVASQDGTRSVMTHRANVEVSGPLGLISEMILRAAAAVITAEFSKRLRSRLEADARATQS